MKTEELLERMYNEDRKTYGGSTSDENWWDYELSVDGPRFLTNFTDAMNGLARIFVDAEDEHRKVESITVRLTDGQETTFKLLGTAG